MPYNVINEPPGGGSWEEDALCREYDSSLWLLSEVYEDRKLNTERFEEAEVICSKCPVFSQCWKYADDDDKAVTMRAGAWPTDYRPPGRGEFECANGHDQRLEGAVGKDGRCAECNREKVARYRTRVANAKAVV